jgi:hypothetical protein
MNLLAGFDAAPLAAAMLESIERKCAGRGKVNKRVGMLSIYGAGWEPLNVYAGNAYHMDLAFVKALKLLQTQGKIELVSLCKTRVKRGLVHCASGTPMGFRLATKAEVRCAALLRPARYIKYGDPTD